MDLVAEFVDAVKAAVGARINAGDVITIVGKLLPGGEARGFTDDLVALDDEAGAVGMDDDPFAPEEGDCVVRGVLDGDEINEGVGRLAPP